MSLWVAVLLLFTLSSISWPIGSATTTVTHLPGFDGPLPFHLETGYVEVDEVNEAYMFYYFVKSEETPEEDPILLWHTGGPGCSGFSALATEIGPLKVDVAAFNEGRPFLYYNKYTWSKMSNIIFVDSPIGTGFSYSRAQLYYPMTTTKSALQVHTFMEKWLMEHPEFRDNPFYIGGDSHGGLVAPLIAQDIADGNQAGKRMFINLKGYLIGNSPVDPQFDDRRMEYAHRMGLISNELYETAEDCRKNHTAATTEYCKNSYIHTATCVLFLDYEHILVPNCALPNWARNKVGIDRTMLKKDPLIVGCRFSVYFIIIDWANLGATRQALGVREETVRYWERCSSSSLLVNYTGNVNSTLQNHLNLTSRGYRALVYSGDHDLVMPHVGTQAWIKSLNFPIVDDWRPWLVERQVGGYTRTYSNNLTFATVLGAGHTAPEYRPKECLAMYGRWVSNVPL